MELSCHALLVYNIMIKYMVTDIVAQVNFISNPGLSNVTPVVQWMPKPETFQGCPPGLEYLLNIDQVLVHQQVELLEG